MHLEALFSQLWISFLWEWWVKVFLQDSQSPWRLYFCEFIALFKYVKFYFANKRLPKWKDNDFCDPETNGFKKDSGKFLILCIACRFFYGFAIIFGLSLANDSGMNDGIVYAIRTCEALFVALWTYLLLNEKLTKSKLALSLLGLLVSQSLRLVDMLALIYGLRY